MGNLLKADGSAADAYVEFDAGSNQSAYWITDEIEIDDAAYAYWFGATPASFMDLYRADLVGAGGAGSQMFGSILEWAPADADVEITTSMVHTVEWNLSGGDLNFYVDGDLVRNESGELDVRYFRFGVFLAAADPANVAYHRTIRIGTTRGGIELFSFDPDIDGLDAWTATSGDVSIVADPFDASSLRGICWAPTNATLDENPTWVRLDDPDGYRLADGFTITRGRQDVTDKTATGVATVTFRDTNGYLDPTNPSGPWYGKLDPMKQAAIALRNPVTDEWHTLFRGFVAGPDHELDMFTTERGFDRVTWQLVDAFDLFANVILTHGVHGHTPGLTSFPNIYYQGTPSNLSGEADVFVHVDQRIAQLLDDAGWPNTGETRSGLRNIFSGNVSVQGTVYSRKDSLMSALFDAADAEFPGIANIFVSKDGVVTFHGRFARFFPDRPGYGINHWYVADRSQAEIDPDVAPFAGPLRFYRSKDDIINASHALPQGVDETDAGVVHASDATSQGKYGYRSENFDGLIVSAGHNDDLTDTTAVEEANKFSSYIVGNYKDPKTRVGTLRFRPRSVGSVGATALWDLMTRVEIGDVVTLTTPHAGGGGFDEDFYVEQIRYSAAPARDDMLDITLELEVSPATFFAYNPFGDVDLGES